MPEYDKGFLQSSFLSSLSRPQTMEWLLVDDIRPKPNHSVLLFGPSGRQEVGRLDHSIGMWVVAGEVVPFETFTHWRLLPESPSSK